MNYQSHDTSANREVESAAEAQNQPSSPTETERRTPHLASVGHTTIRGTCSPPKAVFQLSSVKKAFKSKAFLFAASRSYRLCQTSNPIGRGEERRSHRGFSVSRARCRDRRRKTEHATGPHTRTNTHTPSWCSSRLPVEEQQAFDVADEA